MKVALWNWRADPVPDAQIVVAWPGLWLGGERANARARDAFDDAARAGTRMVMPLDEYEADGAYMDDVIPALHVAAQADLDGERCHTCWASGERCGKQHAACNGSGHIGGLRGLLAVQAERRALVCSPRGEIDLSAANLWEPSPQDIAYPLLDLIDLVVIAGFDEPLRPDYVRSIVRQCRDAGVPVVLQWGEWVPGKHAAPGLLTGILNTEGWHCKMIDGELFYRVGSARSGALLDGAEIADEIPWIGCEG